MKKRHAINSGLTVAVCLICLTVAVLSATVFSGCKKKTEENSTITTTTTTSATTTLATIETTTLSDTTVSASAATADIPEDVPPYGWCIASSMNVRKTPNPYYESIGGLRYGERVTIIGREMGHEGYWYKIKFKDGEAYVKAEFISATEIMTTTTAFVSTTTTTAQ